MTQRHFLARWFGAFGLTLSLVSLVSQGTTSAQTLAETQQKADQGDADAQVRLGFMYTIGDLLAPPGEGLPQDSTQAGVWYRRAADQGHAGAQFILGLMYAEGQGVPQDYVEALKWYNLAVSRGTGDERKFYAENAETLDALAEQMTPAQLAEAQKRAVEWQATFEKRQADPDLYMTGLSPLGLSAGAGPIAVQEPVAAPSTVEPIPDAATASRLAREGRGLSAQQVSESEDRLKDTPDDLPTRARLLGYYFAQGVTAAGLEATRAARRRHILWVIEHHPENDITMLSEFTIDPAGHSLADAEGYGQARTLWLGQIDRRKGDVRVLVHAARFFQLSDKALALTYLKQAVQLAPNDPDIASRLGYTYAISALGITMINNNGLPMSADSAEASGEAAKTAITDLRASSNLTVLAVAVSILSQYGVIASAYTGGAINQDALIEELLLRAAALVPNDPGLPAPPLPTVNACSQVGGRDFVVLDTAEAFVRPARLRVPVAVLPSGTAVRWVRSEADWRLVRFADQRWGERTAYVHCSTITVAPGAPAQPLSETITAAPSATTQPFPETTSSDVLVGDGLVRKELFFESTRVNEIFTVTVGSFAPDSQTGLAVVGDRGAVFLTTDGVETSTVEFDAQMSNAVPVDVEGDGIFEFMAQGYGWSPVGLVGHEGETRWQYDPPSAPNAMALGDLDDDGEPEFVVGLNAGGGLRVLDAQGQEKWSRDGSNIFSVAVLDTDRDGQAEIVHSQGNEIWIRSATGEVLRRLSPGFNVFSLTEWPGETSGTRLIGSHSGKLTVIDFEGRLEAEFAAANIGSSPQLVSVRLGSGERMFALVSTLGATARRSALHIFDADGTLVYHEVLPFSRLDHAVLRASGETPGDTLFVGGGRSVWTYRIAAP